MSHTEISDHGSWLSQSQAFIVVEDIVTAYTTQSGKNPGVSYPREYQITVTFVKVRGDMVPRGNVTTLYNCLPYCIVNSNPTSCIQEQGKGCQVRHTYTVSYYSGYILLEDYCKYM